MDTDDLEDMAYRCLIVSSGRKCRDPMLLVGVSSRGYSTEDNYLRGVLGLLEEILEDPDDFLEENCFEEAVDSPSLVASLDNLAEDVHRVLLTPIEDRGISS